MTVVRTVPTTIQAADLIESIAAALKVVVPIAAGLALATAARSQPPPQQMRATLDSPFIGQLLRQPMPPSAAEEVSLFYFSGNELHAELLRQAYKRAALAQLVGESPTTAPATIGNAIANESAASSRGSLGQASEAAASRVIVTYPAGALQLSVRPQSNTHSSLTVTLRAANQLAAPVTSLVALAGPNDLSVGPDALGLSCKPTVHTAIAPGATEDIFCEGGRATDQIGAAVDALNARQRLTVHTVVTPTVTLAGTNVLLPVEADRDRGQVAMARLAALPCEQKGSCNAIAAEAQRTWKTQKGPTLLLALAALALFVSAVAASRQRVVAKETSLGAAAAVAVLLFALFGVTTAWLGLAPGDARYLAMMGFVIVWYGALPFLAVLGGLAATIRAGNVTRLRVLAVTFGVLSTALVMGSVLLD